MASASTGPPSGGLPLSERKQQFSLAYVHIVATAAGFWLKHHATDYDGVDLTIASSSDYATCFGPEFELQVKCTSQSRVIQSDAVAWSMEAKPFRKLTNPKRYTPAYLGLLVVPEDPETWLVQDEQQLLTHSRMYWQAASQLGRIDDDAASKTVHLPSSNLFDVPHLRSIMDSIGNGGDA